MSATRWSKFISVLIVVLIVSDALGKDLQIAPELNQTFYNDAKRKVWTKPPASGEDLHVILVIDVFAINAVKLGVITDGVTMLRLLQTFFPDGQSGQHKLASVKIIIGANVNRDTIIKSIRNIPSKPRDTILFYYSGHGGSDQETFRRLRNPYDYDNCHFLATSSGIVYRTEIKRALAACQGQLRIVITDCCANFHSIQATGKSLKDESSFRQTINEKSILKDNKDKYLNVAESKRIAQMLFFDQVGWVSINAAPPSQTTPGFERTGGMFTFNMVKEINSIKPALLNIPGALWDVVGHVQVKEYNQKNPYPNPGGVRNGLEDPRFVYSMVYSTGETIDAIELKLYELATKERKKTLVARPSQMQGIAGFWKVSQVTVDNELIPGGGGGLKYRFFDNGDFTVNASSPFVDKKGTYSIEKNFLTLNFKEPKSDTLKCIFDLKNDCLTYSFNSDSKKVQVILYRE